METSVETPTDTITMAHSEPGIKFSVPKPPARETLRTDPEATRRWVRDRLHHIFEAATSDPAQRVAVDTTAYMAINGSIHDYVVRSQSPSGGRISQAGERSKRLYLDLRTIATTHCQDIRGRIIRAKHEFPNNDGEAEMMLAYGTAWRRYHAVSVTIKNLYSNLDRHWVHNEMCDGNTKVFLVHDLLMKVWRNEIVLSNLYIPSPVQSDLDLSPIDQSDPDKTMSVKSDSDATISVQSDSDKTMPDDSDPATSTQGRGNSNAMVQDRPNFDHSKRTIIDISADFNDRDNIVGPELLEEIVASFVKTNITWPGQAKRYGEPRSRPRNHHESPEGL